MGFTFTPLPGDDGRFVLGDWEGNTATVQAESAKGLEKFFNNWQITGGD
jgi:hypothetical protein